MGLHLPDPVSLYFFEFTSLILANSEARDLQLPTAFFASCPRRQFEQCRSHLSRFLLLNLRVARHSGTCRYTVWNPLHHF